MCLQVEVEEAVCTLAILGTDPTLVYGTLANTDTSDFQSLFVANLGNAPAVLKVIVTDWFDQSVIPIKVMEGSQTHFSVVDPGVTNPVTFYDGVNSFAVSTTLLTIIDQIFDGGEVLETFWQLRIDLLNFLFFGDLDQTMTLQLQDCSTANLCEIMGGTCPQTGTQVEGPG